MSVKKNTPNFLKHSGFSFTTILNQTIELIPDDGALGIYCYLSSKSENWDICIENLKNRFGKGRDYIRKKLSILKEIGLINTEAVRDEKGKILHWETTLLNTPKNHITENPHCGEKLSTVHITENPESGKPRRLEKPALLNKRNNEIKEINKIKERARKKRVPLPPDFYPDSNNILKLKEASVKSGLTEETLLTKFKAWYKEKNEKSEDWQAKLEYFLAQEKPKKIVTEQTKQVAATPNETRSTVPEWGPGHPTWEANQEWNRRHQVQEKEIKDKKEVKPYARSQGSEIARDNTRRDSVRKATSYLPQREIMD